MAEKPPIDFASRAKAIREAREGKPDQQVSQNAEDREPENVISPTFGRPSPETPSLVQGLPEIPEHQTEKDPRTPRTYSMRTMSKASYHFGGSDMFMVRHLVGNDEDAQRKFDHVVAMDNALTALRKQMHPTKGKENIALRRGILRSSGTTDLAEQFWNSTPHDWTAKPSTYIALLDELEERGFFAIPSKERS